MYSPAEAWKIINPLLLSSGIPKVLHNMKFDMLFIYHTTGVRMEGVEFDTMLMLHALDSGIQGCLSLKTAIWDHCPDLNLGGYEELLPKLTKVKKTDDSEESEESEEDEAGDE
jgi:DNA polymerase I-like protein with 3'-5' exonuclease and polymerase domains